MRTAGCTANRNGKGTRQGYKWLTAFASKRAARRFAKKTAGALLRQRCGEKGKTAAAKDRRNGGKAGGCFRFMPKAAHLAQKRPEQRRRTEKQPVQAKGDSGA